MPDSTCLVRVLLAGFHPLILDDSQLQTGDECEVHVINPDECMLLRAVDRLRPNVIVLDLLRTSSLRTIQRVRETSPSCDVVALTEMRRMDIAEQSFRPGHRASSTIPDAASELLVAIRTVLAGQRYLSPTFTKSSTDAARERSRSPIQLSASDEPGAPSGCERFPGPSDRPGARAVAQRSPSLHCLPQTATRSTHKPRLETVCGHP